MHKQIVIALAVLLGAAAVARSQSISITPDVTNTVREVSATSDIQGDGQDFQGTPQDQTLHGLGQGGFSQMVQSNVSSDNGSIAFGSADQDSEIDLNPFHIFWSGTAMANTQRNGFDASTNAVGRSIGDFYFNVNGSAVGYTMQTNVPLDYDSGGDHATLRASLNGPNGIIASATPGQQQTLTGTLSPGHYELLVVADANFLDQFVNFDPGSSGGVHGTVDLTFSAAMQQRLPGDANDDGKVGFADLLILAQNYGKSPGQTFDTGDFNNDGGVGFDDLLILAQHYGEMQTAAPAAAPVPEPASLGAAGALAFLLLGRRRR